MMNTDKLKKVIEAYKADFSEHFKEECYKWEAVKWFQDNWDINAPVFGEMFDRATAQDKTQNLLTSKMVYPRGMILEFAKADDNATRKMFRVLFDESRDLSERVSAFKEQADTFVEKYGKGKWKNHYQNTNYISTYLWLRYPDKYYIYKYELFKKCAEYLEDSYRPKANGSAETMIGGFKMYDEICEILSKDTELKQMLESALTDSCYKDRQLKTMTIDFGFYLARFYIDSEEKWFPSLEEYTPGFSVEDWLDLLNNKDVFDESSLIVIQRFYEIGGQATCSELADKYGNNPMHYSGIVTGLAKRIYKETNCPLVDDDNAKWWPILFVEKYADKEQQGVYIWKLRDELKRACELNMDEKEFINKNTKVTYISEIVVALKKLGGTATLSEIYNAIQERNLLTAIKTNPTWKNSVRSEIQRHCSETKSFIEGNEELFYSVYGLNKGVWGLIGFNPDEIENGPSTPIEKHKKYSKENLLSEVYITEKQYGTLSELLKHKKNIIMQGAPGVGKTFTAKRLAYSLIGKEDDNYIEFIQFHQSYSYEDFIMGYRPNDEGDFELKEGVFYRFCNKARNDNKHDYYFIIDEINRGNLSKIFGELLMLIENDYRNETVTLAYRDEKFSVPDNLYIIGMMNTADRSLAMIDYALRRRFSFFEMEPGFDSKGFKSYSYGLNNDIFNSLIAQVKLLNNVIENDNSLGKGFCIGHSYFCNLTAETCTADRLRAIVEYDIIPMLREYWFDDKDKADKWSVNLRGIIDDD